MAVRLSEEEIARLIAERKHLPRDYRMRIQMRPKRGHKERELDVLGAKGSRFRLILRQSLLNVLDFSVILVFCPPESNQLFRLRRYNGRHGEHTNRIEGETFFDYHIHTATERYQELGMREDTYAERTDQFSDLFGAIYYMLRECNFDIPADQQTSLLEEGRDDYPRDRT